MVAAVSASELAQDRRERRFGVSAVAGGSCDQFAGTRGGRLEHRVGDVVGHAAIDLVAEAGEHGDRRRCDRASDRLGIEHGEFVAGPAAADHDECVEIGSPSERGDRCRDRTFGDVALHARVDHGQSESECAAHQLVAEVVPRRRADTRDDPDPEGDRRQRMPLVRIEQPLGDQAADHFVARLGDLADGVAGVDPAHLQPDAPVGRVVVEVAEDADLHAVGETEAVLLQQGAESHP